MWTCCTRVCSEATFTAHQDPLWQHLAVTKGLPPGSTTSGIPRPGPRRGPEYGRRRSIILKVYFSRFVWLYARRPPRPPVADAAGRLVRVPGPPTRPDERWCARGERHMSEQRAPNTAEPADQCPGWCVRDHSAELREAPFYHASETSLSSDLVGHGTRVYPRGSEVQTAQYVPDDPGETAWTPTVEVALYTGSRYRVISLTPEEARQRCRDAGPGPRTCRAQPGTGPAAPGGLARGALPLNDPARTGSEAAGQLYPATSKLIYIHKTRYLARSPAWLGRVTTRWPRRREELTRAGGSRGSAEAGDDRRPHPGVPARVVGAHSALPELADAAAESGMLAAVGRLVRGARAAERTVLHRWSRPGAPTARAPARTRGCSAARTGGR